MPGIQYVKLGVHYRSSRVKSSPLLSLFVSALCQMKVVLSLAGSHLPGSNLAPVGVRSFSISISGSQPFTCLIGPLCTQSLVKDEKKIAGINPLVNRETSFGRTGFPT